MDKDRIIRQILSGEMQAIYTPYVKVKRDNIACNICKKGERENLPLTVSCFTNGVVFVCFDCVLAYNTAIRASVLAKQTCESNATGPVSAAFSEAATKALADAFAARNASIEARNAYYRRNVVVPQEDFHSGIPNLVFIIKALTKPAGYVCPLDLARKCDLCKTNRLRAALVLKAHTAIVKLAGQHKEVQVEECCVCFPCILASGLLRPTPPTALPLPMHRKSPEELLEFLSQKLKVDYTHADKFEEQKKSACSNCFYLNNCLLKKLNLRTSDVEEQYSLCIQCAVDSFRKYR